MPPDPFDPEHFRRRCAATGAQPVSPRLIAGLPRPKDREKYLGGPIPLGWLSRAASLPGKALHLGVALWYAAVRTPGKNPAVALTRSLAATFGLSARTNPLPRRRSVGRGRTGRGGEASRAIGRAHYPSGPDRSLPPCSRRVKSAATVSTDLNEPFQPDTISASDARQPQ